MKLNFILPFILIISLPYIAIGQEQPFTYQGHVPVSADFLRIPAEPKALGMGNLSVATGGDPNASFSNPARVAFGDDYGYQELSSISITYSPIATQIAKDIKMLTLNGYKWIDQGQYIGLSLQYFSLGDVHFFDDQANETHFIIPQEYALGVYYSRQFSEDFGMGLTIKGIVSSLTGSESFAGNKTRAGFSLAADYGFFGKIPTNTDDKIQYGLAITNIGSKLTYSDNGIKSYLPMNLKFGGAYKHVFGDSYLLTGLEFNKPLVPSAPLYDKNGVIIAGQDPDKSIPAAIFGSFNDSPNGAGGELKEFGVNLGLEAGFSNQFFARAGYYSEAKQLGVGSYLTFGLGLYKDLNNKRLKIDVGYAMPSAQNLALKGMFKIGIAVTAFE